MYLLRIKNNPGLESYVRRLRRALAESEIPFDRKKFSPHITLIRKVSFQNGVIDTAKKIIIPNSAMVRRVSLMRSVQGKNGMIYTELGSIG
jgi:2'-5' RNA ligase